MTELLMARSATTLPDIGKIVESLTGSSFSGSALEFIDGLSSFIGVFSGIYSFFAVLILATSGTRIPHYPCDTRASSAVPASAQSSDL